ncbi:MAG: hypothetical protein ACXWP6_20710 [Ktedonobacterales bacterium]
MNRAYAIDRLRAWARQAQSEAQDADTREDILNWQGQAQVLSDVATFLAGPGAQMDDNQIWKQVVADRTRALSNWEREQEGPEAMFYAGMVAGYDYVVTTLADVTGRSWTEALRAEKWLNR